MACANKLAEKKGKPKAVLHGCESCPMASICREQGYDKGKKGNAV
jgi:hypothetical protein